MGFWDGKRVLVTGGAGMIGSHLVELLISNGAEVALLDNFSRPGMVWQEEKARQFAEVYRYDLGRQEPLPSDNLHAAFNQRDVIFHLAARVTGIQYNMEHDYTMLQDNLSINMEMASWIRAYEPDRYVYASTSCIYPGTAPVPTPEEVGEVCNPERTNWGYGIAKWVGEQQAKALQEFGVKVGITRYFNAIGPRDYYDEATSHVVPALIRRFLETDELVIVWGSGNQTRVFVDCRDLAYATMLVAENGCNGLPTNIGHQREVSIQELAYLIKGITDSQAKIAFDRARPDGYPRRAPDMTRMLEVTRGWQPEIALGQSIQDMLADFGQRYLSEAEECCQSVC